jgi:hypothetical protein
VVQCVRLDDLAAGEPVGLIKIDVEGAELEVLRGCEAILQRSRPLLYVENDRAGRSPELIRWLWEREYRLWWHLPPLFNPRNRRGLTENLYPGICSFNMLCLPRESPMRVEGEQEIVDAGHHPALAQHSSPASRAVRPLPAVD